MKTIARIARIVALVALTAPTLGAAADYVVIVNPASKASSMKKAELQRYFLRLANHWPDAVACSPVDLPKGNPVRLAFSREVLGKSMVHVDQFWTQSIFSGRAVPPPEKKSEREVIEFVREYVGGVGYVSAGAVLDGVKKVTVVD